MLRNVSLSVASGEVLGVLGRNGMGKSTLIRALSGLLPVSRGSIRIDGKDVTSWPVHARAGLTTIVQGRVMFPRVTVRDSHPSGHSRAVCGEGSREFLEVGENRIAGDTASGACSIAEPPRLTAELGQNLH